MNNGTRIVTGKNIRLLYPALIKPVSINGSRAKYSTTILISKTDDFTISGVKKPFKQLMKLALMYFADPRSLVRR